MAKFRDDNYWGGGTARTPTSDAQIKRPPRKSIDQLLADSRRGIAPSSYELSQAVKELQDYASQQQARTGSRKLDPTRASQLNALLYEVTPNASKPDMFNNPADAFKPVSQPVYSGPSLGTSGFGGANGVSSAVGAAKDAVGGIGALVADAANAAEAEAANSPEAILARLRREAGTYEYNGPSADQMAKEEFDPQFQLLKSMAEQQTQRYQSNKADISGMYNQLVNAQTAARGQDKAMFDKSVGDTSASYAAASKGLADNATGYSKSMAQELARLGVKEGLGDVVGGVNKNLQDNLGRLTSQGQNTKDLLSGLGANEYAYDTNQIGTAKQAGINTQNDFLKDYLGAMAQNDQQRLQLTGQQQQAENQYGMQIQKLLQEGQGSFEDSILGQYKAIMDAQNNRDNSLFRQAGLDLDQQKFAYQQQQDALKTQNSTNPLNAYDALSQRALTQYGDPIKARSAVDEILAAYRNNPNPQNIGDFLNGLDQDALKANPEMMSLVYDFISRIMADQKK